MSQDPPPPPALDPRGLTRRMLARVALVGGAAAVPALLSAPDAEAAATGSWGVTGTSGTSPATNYLGTKDAQPLVIRTSARERLRVTAAGLVGLGTTAPTALLHAVSATGGALRGDYTGSGVSQGVRGKTTSVDGYGVFGENTSTGAGGGSGLLGLGTVGVAGRSAAVSGYGVSGIATAANPSTVAVYAHSTGPTSNGLKAVADGGGVSYAVWGVADPDSYAGIFQGRVTVFGDLNCTGTLSKAAGTFRIDHPLDPAGRYLLHSFVESPDMLNVYSGTVTVAAGGTAVVTLPGYFDALNTDVRYQLTAVGAPMPDLHVAVPHAGGRFTIGGAVAGQQVSWQVTGVRQDAYAKAHPVVPEVAKPARERGTYLHPVEHGHPEHLRTTLR